VPRVADVLVLDARGADELLEGLELVVPPAREVEVVVEDVTVPSRSRPAAASSTVRVDERRASSP
jgi:hypothetical protein